ncbi:MAG: cupin [Alphaproteobacteria bacterium HGW-Alphaproteobacteria-2]|nr:MAG: cupin [Alphaproteobacteria bacterium HGW-Alphaproteobacteria-2]
MQINADFTRRVAVHPDARAWRASPVPGVERLMLDRLGDEVARATSLVRFAPGSAFSPHIHDGGEEYLVLDGVFQDESGDFPVGSYVRNPPTSRHRPASAPGCTIFVKLWQFDPDDRHAVTLATGDLALAPVADRPGVRAATLHADRRETVRLEHWQPGATIAADPAGGLELLCLDGGFSEAGEDFGPWSWLRLPAGVPLRATAGAEGCRLWLKEGHLRQAPAAPPAAG